MSMQEPACVDKAKLPKPRIHTNLEQNAVSKYQHGRSNLDERSGGTHLRLLRNYWVIFDANWKRQGPFQFRLSQTCNFRLSQDIARAKMCFHWFLACVIYTPKLCRKHPRVSVILRKWPTLNEFHFGWSHRSRRLKKPSKSFKKQMGENLLLEVIFVQWQNVVCRVVIAKRRMMTPTMLCRRA